jgi:hypothetical protein
MTTLIPQFDLKNGGSTPTGAVNRPINQKLAETVSVLDFGAIGDGITECSQAIQNAINYTCSIGASLFFPAGTYIVDALQTIAQQTDGSHPPTRAACFKMTSNLHCYGIKGSTIIKAKSGISTNASPKYFNMFMSNTYDVNVSFDGIIFDLNGQNNPVSPNAPSSYNYYHQAALFWGSDASNVARPDNLFVTNCQFINSGGTNVIVTGFSITVTPAPRGVNCVIANNIFNNNGFNTDDHSTVYLVNNKIWLQNNIFTITSATIIKQNGVEIHGSDAFISGNVIKNYVGGLLVSERNSGDNVFNVNIYDNFYACSFNNISVLRDTTAYFVSDIFIYDNEFTIVDTASPYPQTPASIYVLPTLPVSSVHIHNNIIQKTATTYNGYGIAIGNANPASGSTEDIHVEGNVIKSFTYGISVPNLAGTGKVGKLFITGNTLNSCTTNSISLTPYSGQYIDYVYLQGNRIYNSGTNGISITNTINNMFYAADNFIVSSGSANYTESGATITTRTGVLTWALQLFNVGTVTNGSSSLSAGFTITGASLGDTVAVGAPYDLQGCTATGYVSAANTVKILVANNTGSSQTFSSGVYWEIRVSKQGI